MGPETKKNIKESWVSSDFSGEHDSSCNESLLTDPGSHFCEVVMGQIMKLGLSGVQLGL